MVCVFTWSTSATGPHSTGDKRVTARVQWKTKVKAKIEENLLKVCHEILPPRSPHEVGDISRADFERHHSGEWSERGDGDSHRHSLLETVEIGYSGPRTCCDTGCLSPGLQNPSEAVIGSERRLVRAPPKCTPLGCRLFAALYISLQIIHLRGFATPPINPDIPLNSLGSSAPSKLKPASAYCRVIHQGSTGIHHRM